MAKKDPLKKIKTSPWARGFALAKISVSASAQAASHAVGNLFASEVEKSDRLKEFLKSQIQHLTEELGQLKGSLMKVGQLLSMYGEHFLPPEANAVLKSLQSQSPPLEWKAIDRVIRKQLSPELLADLEIDPEPMASASLGQVHRARRKSTGQWLVMKIQYPGVDQAIEGDLKALRSLLTVSKLVPVGPRYDTLFDEIRMMLHQEVDYLREQKMTRFFKEALSNDPRFIVPEIDEKLSTRRILTGTLEDGAAVDGPEVLSLSQERRNAIGQAVLELYFRELFDLGLVQTDPHFGNYRVRLGKEGEPDRVVLLDFGAVRKLAKGFREPYLKMVRGSLLRNFEDVVNGATELGFILPEDSDERKKAFADFCTLIVEPFFTPEIAPEVPRNLYDANGAYLWGQSDLPKRVAYKGTQLALLFKLRTPPQEIVFLDRKLGGIFIFLSKLQVRFQTRNIVLPYIDKSNSPR